MKTSMTYNYNSDHEIKIAFASLCDWKYLLDHNPVKAPKISPKASCFRGCITTEDSVSLLYLLSNKWTVLNYFLEHLHVFWQVSNLQELSVLNIIVKWTDPCQVWHHLLFSSLTTAQGGWFSEGGASNMKKAKTLNKSMSG